MRTLFTLVGLALMLAVVSLLARQQLATSGASKAMMHPAPGVAPGHSLGPAAPPAQQVQQYQQAVEGLIQQPRTLPSEAQ